MKLDKIEIENFRCFERLTLNLHPELTVLVALNGGGKTTLLDAMRIALWPFVKAFDLGSQTGKSSTIQISDVRLKSDFNQKIEAIFPTMEPQLPSSILAVPLSPFDGMPQRWRQRRERIASGTNTLSDDDTKKLTLYGKSLQSRVTNKSESLVLPLIAYLGTGRLWYQGRYTSDASEVTLDISATSRLSGYLNCLTFSSNFKQFTDWYGWIYRSYREGQLIALEQGGVLDEKTRFFANAIQVVKQAVNNLVQQETGWANIEYSARYAQQIVLTHPQNGTLPVEQLSDGLRNAIAMVADIAFRAFKLNPHLGVEAAKLAYGIVLIDEVDMFLHPSWQQTVIASLRETFPDVQFVVTTHSPQVLTTVKRENIRLLTHDSERGWYAKLPRQEIKGVESGVALNDAMLVNPIPPVKEAQWLADYIAKIESGTHEDADGLDLREKLSAFYGVRHPVMLDADRLIRFQTFKLRKNSTHRD